MVASQFQAILQDLEPFFKCKLEPDNNNSCLIKMSSGIKIQIELDRYGDHLLIATRLGVLPAGRFRELVFKEALKANASDSPSQGVFGYSKKSEQLILFLMLDLRAFTSDKMISLLTPFIQKGQKWSDMISRGEVPFLRDMAKNAPSSMFGLIH